MSYTKTIWKNGTTEVTDKNLNNIENGIEALDKLTSNMSNPNLLINGDFQVWQRGINFNGDNSGVQYTADRWRMVSDAGMKLTQEPYGVRIETTSVGGWHNFEQYIELPKYLKGKKVTVSIKLHSAGVIKQFYAGVKKQNGDILFLATELSSVAVDSFKHTFEIPNGDYNLLFVGIQAEERIGAKLEIEYFKLELGEHVTQFIPRSYGEELALCRRYCQVLDYNINVGGKSASQFSGELNRAHFDIDLSTPMRILPIVTTVTPNSTGMRFVSGGGVLQDVKNTITIVSSNAHNNVTNLLCAMVLQTPTSTPSSGWVDGFIMKLDSEIY